MPPATSPSTSLYTLGKGVLSISPWSGLTPPTLPYTDVGNCPTFDLEVTETRLDHFTSRYGSRLKDKQVVIEIGYKITFVLDELAVNNMKMLLKATLVGANVLRAATVLNTEYALKFVSNNPEGPNYVYLFRRAKLAANGALNLIGDDWLKMSFTAEGLADLANHSESPYFDMTFASTTTSTTTTTPP